MQGSDVTPERGVYRFLGLRHGPGAEQLAVTEAILAGVASGASPPTLRLYSWSEPVVILGVSQPAADLDLDACRSLGFRVLRRLSGGTAVYHDADAVSLDLIVPPGSWFAPSDITLTYARVSEVIGQALARFGAHVRAVEAADARKAVTPPELQPACFGGLAPFELVTGTRKVVGLSQVRRRGVVAVQAAVYTRFPYQELARVLRVASVTGTERWTALLRERAAGLDDLLGEPVDPHAVASALHAAFATAIPGDLETGMLLPAEVQAAAQLTVERYGSEAWTLRR
ncbi:hypothetical protein [Sphaerobacter sp.]|uniref:lipoate--protein ligase family protein n=1 Tax=Sphaerobacter sp. TaxID=2099654 RepID=UPI001D9C3239|nr:hypothetical protein [Sphaerobacter sp.]MBX5443808.1 hypothetical protein [Sphaerobacter sp.]